MNPIRTVLVLESHARASVQVIRSLLARGLDVTAGSDRRFCAGFSVRGLNRKAIYPSVTDKPDEFIVWLLEYLETQSIDWLLPLGDVAVDLIARNQQAIRTHSKLVMPAYEDFSRAYDKILTNQAAEAAGLPIPASWYPDENGLDAAISSKKFPLLVKPAVGVGARGIVRAQGPAELERAWSQACEASGRHFVQECLPLTGRQFVLDMLVDGQGQVAASVASEKVRLFPVSGGAATLSRSIISPELSEMGAKLLQQVNYIGLANIDWIEDPRDGVAKLLEINPRFGEMHGIASVVGVDMPGLMYDLACGRDLPAAASYPAGRLMRFGPTDLMWFIRSPDRFRASPGFWRSLSGKVAHTLVADGDFGPLAEHIYRIRM